VFGTAGKKQALTGIALHYGYFGDPFVNDFHRERIGHFWSCYLDEQQAVLSTFAPDIALAFSRAKANVREACVQAQLNPKDNKLEMRPVIARSLPTWLEPAAAHLTEPAPTSESRVSPKQDMPAAIAKVDNVSRQETNTAISTNVSWTPEGLLEAFGANRTSLGIAICWTVPVDCDLYVKPGRRARELSYRRRVTKEGRYYYDERQGGSTFYEYVELLPGSSIDVRETRAWVNMYAGSASSLRGTVIVFYDGKINRGEFQLLCTSGNRGKEASSRDKSPYWCEIDLMGIIGLSPSRRLSDAR